MPSAANCCGLDSNCNNAAVQRFTKSSMLGNGNDDAYIYWDVLKLVCWVECWLPQSFLLFVHLFYDYLVSFLALHKIRRRLFLSRFSFSVSISIPIFVDCHSFYYCCHCHWIVYIKYNVIDRRGTTFFCFVSSDAIFRFRYPFSGFFDRFFSSSAICIGWVFCIL